MNKQIKPTTEEEKIKISEFLNNGYFEIIQQGDYFFFGVKKGFFKALLIYHNKKEIKIYLDRIEELINFGCICSECLSFCDYVSESDINAEYFKCGNCEGLKNE